MYHDTMTTTTMTERLVLRAVPTMPEMVTAAQLAERLPYLSRSAVDRALRSLAGTEVEVFLANTDTGTPKHYARRIEGSSW